MILRFYIKNLYIVNFDFKVPTNSLTSWCNISEKQLILSKMLKWYGPFPWFVIKSCVLSCPVCYGKQLMSQGVTHCCIPICELCFSAVKFDTTDATPYYLVSMTMCGENICIILIRIFFQAFNFFLKNKSFSLQWNLFFFLIRQHTASSFQ